MFSRTKFYAAAQALVEQHELAAGDDEAALAFLVEARR